MPTLDLIFLDSSPEEDVAVKLQNQRPRQLADLCRDATLVMAAVLTEQLAPVGPEAEPERVLQRRSLRAVMARHAHKPADVLLSFRHHLVTLSAHVALANSLVLKVVSGGVSCRRPARV